MEFDWIDVPFDLKTITPKEIEESFEDPFGLRLLPDGVEDDAKARYFNLGKSIGDRAIFSREMTPEELSFYDRKNSEAGY